MRKLVLIVYILVSFLLAEAVVAASKAWGVPAGHGCVLTAYTPHRAGNAMRFSAVVSCPRRQHIRLTISLRVWVGYWRTVPRSTSTDAQYAGRLQADSLWGPLYAGRHLYATFAHVNVTR